MGRFDKAAKTLRRLKPIDLDKVDLGKHDYGTLWEQAHNYALNTYGSWNYKPSPYCNVPECYEPPVAEGGKCKKHDAESPLCAVPGCFEEPIAGPAGERGRCEKHKGGAKGP